MSRRCQFGPTQLLWRRLWPALALSWCLASATVGLVGSPPAAAVTHTGPVDVLSAGSLQNAMQTEIGPAFTKATGYTLNNTSMGSDALANGIKGGMLQGDVFISASPTVNAKLEGSANGDWVSWYAEFATSPLVLGYNQASKFAHALKTKPWYQVVDQPGFLLGRTDPTIDPKGVLAVTALDETAKKHHLSALTALTAATNNVFPETTLVGQLQAGQLDAGFFYGVEAATANIRTVLLTGTNLAGDYTITILHKAPHQAAARAFLAFLLGKDGQRILRKNGIVPIMPPRVSGKSSVPSGVKATL